MKIKRCEARVATDPAARMTLVGDLFALPDIAEDRKIKMLNGLKGCVDRKGQEKP